MILLSAILLIITLIFSLLYIQTDVDIFETLAITFGTTAYHFAMRLLVGFSIVFVITSLIASLMEIACIIAQRYNRPRLIRMMERKSRKNSEIKR